MRYINVHLVIISNNLIIILRATKMLHITVLYKFIIATNTDIDILTCWQKYVDITPTFDLLMQQRNCR